MPLKLNVTKTPKAQSEPIICAHVPDNLDELAPRLDFDRRIKAQTIEHVPTDRLTPDPRNAKKHPDRQIALLQANFEQFGFTNPILIAESNVILGGHARYYAAVRSGITHLPCIRLTHLSEKEKRALAIADNKLAELGKWDLEILSEDLKILDDPELESSLDIRILGFDTPEIDDLLAESDDRRRADLADEVAPPAPGAIAVTEPGDHWICDDHALVCGDALDAASFTAVMGGDKAQMCFTDPPYNVPNAGHVTKRDGVREFPMAHGEMSHLEFTEFMAKACSNTGAHLAAGGTAFFCMDWRHSRELQNAAEPVFGQMKNIIVWAKANAGLGTFYRSQHEFIQVYRLPGSHINNFGLGGKGRYRTNVWNYRGQTSFGRHRDEELAMHPTVKPVALVVDAIKDCSARGGIILDPFGGSGTTMIAAQRTGRKARLIEIDPLYCDTIAERWQKFSGRPARLAGTNETFVEVKARRRNHVS